MCDVSWSVWLEQFRHGRKTTQIAAHKLFHKLKDINKETPTDTYQRGVNSGWAGYIKAEMLILKLIIYQS